MNFNFPETNNIAGLVNKAVHEMMASYSLQAVFADSDNQPWLAFRPESRTFDVLADYPNADQTPGAGIDWEEAKPILQFSWDDVLKSLVGFGWDKDPLPDEVDEDVLDEIGFDTERVATIEALDHFVKSLTDLRDKWKAAQEKSSIQPT